MCLISWPGPAAGVALCRPVPREAAGRNHRSFYPSLKQPPPDPQLYQGGHGRQGDDTESLHNAMDLQQRSTQVMHDRVILFKQMSFMFALGHEGCRDQGTHRK